MPRLDLQRRFFAEELRRFRQFMEPGRVLDVGFGLGAFLQEAHLAGWKTEGIESSSAAYDYSKKALSSEVLLRLGDFARVNLVRDSYDLICFWDVLAHVEDPRAYLLKARSLLSANGIIVIKTPIRPTKRFSRLGYFPPALRRSLIHWPTQIYHFSPESLRIILEGQDFTITDFRLLKESGNIPIPVRSLLTHPRGMIYYWIHQWFDRKTSAGVLYAKK